MTSRVPPSSPCKQDAVPGTERSTTCFTDPATLRAYIAAADLSSVADNMVYRVWREQALKDAAEMERRNSRASDEV